MKKKNKDSRTRGGEGWKKQVRANWQRFVLFLFELGRQTRRGDLIAKAAYRACEHSILGSVGLVHSAERDGMGW